MVGQGHKHSDPVKSTFEKATDRLRAQQHNRKNTKPRTKDNDF